MSLKETGNFDSDVLAERSGASTSAKIRRSVRAAADAAKFPVDLKKLGDLQTAIPRIAKNQTTVSRIEEYVQRLPTTHRLQAGDARNLSFIPDSSVHLIVTSPPYWNLKEYRDSAGQMGHINDYGKFIEQLNLVWAHCLRILVPGGRLVCVVGDVCLSRKKNAGEHTVVPLHASIQTECRRLGFSNLAPIIWYKIANAKYEAEGNGAGFLGKPYEPNSVVKNDIEFLLMERKPGGYRSPSIETRVLSVISGDRHKAWFRQIWDDVAGASTREHPAPYPVQLAERLVRMFSFVGDTVLDPFVGTGTTMLAAAKCGRNSVGIEVDSGYLGLAANNLRSKMPTTARLEVIAK